MPKVSPEHLEARRLQIMDAALECFSRQGFHRTTMADVVRETRLSVGAIYRYFKTKDEIIEAVSDQRHARERQLILEAARCRRMPETLERLLHGFLASLADPKQRRQRRLGVQIWAEALRNPAMLRLVRRGVDEPRKLLAALIREGQERGELDAAIDADALARVWIAIFHGFVLQLAWDPKLAIGPFRTVVAQLARALANERPGPRRGR